MDFWGAEAGFLGTHASLRADVSLVLVLLSAFLFTLGWRLAVHKKWVAHQWVQNAAFFVNTLVVIFTMLVIYFAYHLAGLSAVFINPVVTVLFIHAMTGTLGVLLGLYIVLSANGILPGKMRIKKKKSSMRISYSLYMLVTIVGTSLYFYLYL